MNKASAPICGNPNPQSQRSRKHRRCSRWRLLKGKKRNGEQKNQRGGGGCLQNHRNEDKNAACEEKRVEGIEKKERKE